MFVSIGIFDGVHRGHREILGHLLRQAGKNRGRTAVITFDPHPRSFLQPDHPPRILTSLEEKSAILESLGIDLLIVLSFNEELAAVEGEQFVQSVLVDRLHTKKIIVGYDFRLGRGREGGSELLFEMGRRLGFEATFIDPVEHEGKPVKSTWIRDEIEGGDVGRAADLLDRYYSISGRVETGSGRGRSLGAATANLSVPDRTRLWPGDGVYAVYVELEEKTYPAVANVGVKPTFNGKERSMEAHLLDFEGELVDRKMTVHFVRRLRNEKKFDSADSLSRQIAKDVRAARELLEGQPVKYLFTAR